jgi:tetratricopeptide (TPR) repeat protein
MSLTKNLQRLTEQLSATDADPAEVLQRFIEATRPPGVNEALRRCALPRWFDDGRYRNILSEGVAGAPTLDDLARQSDVEILARKDGVVYAVRSPARERYLSEWQKDPEAAVKLHALLAEYEQERPKGEQDTPTLLYHLLRCDRRAQALKVFNQAFDEAEAKFDLPECYRVLAILDDLQGELGPELYSAHQQKQQIYRSRALFADAFYRSATYYHRQEPLEEFERMRSSEDRQIYHLHATGGMGKTIFLRWLLARHLVPQRVPCARIDFDEILQASVVRYPALLLLPICEQLNVQLPRTYFTELIQKLKPYEHLVRPGVSDESEFARTSDPSLELWDIHVRSFVSAIERDSGLLTVVLLLDTLEGVTLVEDDFLRIFSFLEKLLAGGIIRLILSGRYEIGSKAAAVREALEKRAVTYHLTRFADEDARGYLQSRRLNDSATIEAIVNKVREPRQDKEAAGSNPFKLALFAELALSRESITAEDIEKMPNAEFAYLLERVVKRIPQQPLRWVVRYGALPRTLTPAYIEGVLLEPLQRVLRGESAGDELKEYVLEGSHDFREQDYWEIDANADLDAAKLWNELGRYVSDSGWLSRSTPDGSEVRFHPDVADPMRDLLSRQQIFEMLQQRSIRYFEKLASEDRHADWISEAIFHTFQLRGPAGEEYWKEQLEQARDIAARLRIASEVLRREYCEEERRPRLRGESRQEIISPATLALAHAETTRAILETADFWAEESVDWSAVKRHVVIAEELEAQFGIQVLGPALKARYQAATAVEGQRFQDAAETLKAALANITQPAHRFWLEYDLARVLESLGDRSSETHFREAIGLLRQARIDFPEARLRKSLAAWLRTDGQFLASYEEYEKAIAAAGSDAEARRDVESQLAWTAIRAGDYARAAAAAENVMLADPKWPPAYRLQGWLRYGLKDPLKALAAAEQALSMADKGSEDEALAHDLLAVICVDLAQLSRAFAEWQQPLQLRARAGTENVAESIMLDQVGLKAYEIGDFKGALLTAEEAQRLKGTRDPDIDVRLQLARIFAQWRMGNRDAARAGLTSLLAPQSPERSPFLGIMILTNALATGLIPEQELLLERLCELLEALQLASARFEQVSALRHRVKPVKTSRRLRERILALFPQPQTDQIDFAEKALIAGHLQRLFGSAAVARRLFGTALPLLIGRGSILIGAIRAIEGLRLAGSAELWEHQPLTQQGLEFASGILQLEHIRSRLDDDAKADVAAELSQAQSLIDSAESLLTRWHALAPELKARVELANGHAGIAGVFAAQAADCYQRLGDLKSVARCAELAVKGEVRSAQRRNATPGADGESSCRRIRVVPPKSLPFNPSLEEMGEFLVQEKAPELLASALFDVIDRNSIESAPEIEFEVTTVSSASSAVPWEWVPLPPRVKRLFRNRERGAPQLSSGFVSWIQSSLVALGRKLTVDGFYGGITAAALQEFALENGIEERVPGTRIVRALRTRTRAVVPLSERRILVVQPRSLHLGPEEASYESRTGSSIEPSYQEAPGETRILHEPTVNRLRKEIERFQPHALHFIAAMKSLRGLAYLEFTRAAEEKHDLITAPLLSQILQVRPRGAAAQPFVVLDIARPSSTWEAAYTLCLRNQFANDLFHSLETCSGVLATGIAQPWQQGDIGSRIARNLTQNASLGEIADALRASIPGTRPIDERLAYTGTALFTAEPELPCISIVR